MTKDKHICPIMYIPIESNQKYSIQGMKKISPALQDLQDLPYTVDQQLIEARTRADKMSIQGVQPKLSAKFNVKKQTFEICDQGGTYILKPQNIGYAQLPENEDLTMRMAATIIEIPFHGLIYGADGKFTYYIKRFDRVAHANKIPVEDFAQLAGCDRDTKYEYSMEKMIILMDQYCTFPSLTKSKLFSRFIFNYLVGNEDMHLKNYSLITRNGIVDLAPGYDFINTTLAIGVNKVKEEIALPLNGKKNNLNKKDIIEYFGKERLGLTDAVIEGILSDFAEVIPEWYRLIEISFLSDSYKEMYASILQYRISKLRIA